MVYIKGIGAISPQKTFDKDYFLEDWQAPEKEYYSCHAPDYKQYISPIRLRRMVKILKMGVSAAHISLNDAQVEVPDAITVGTCLGCLENTEKFLTTMLDNGEELMTPTSFIQSTHNAVASQIALMLKCKGYNYTYVNRGFSFESALLDAMLLLKEKEAETVLTGGIDELTRNYHFATKKRGQWKLDTEESKSDILNSKTPGAFAGEGTAFFLLSGKPDPDYYACIRGMKMIYKPTGVQLDATDFENFLHSAGAQLADVDTVVLGFNGNVETDRHYHTHANTIFKNKSQVYFKSFFGEFHTASALALWLTSKIIKEQYAPELTKVNHIQQKEIKNVLIYNHWNGIEHSLILLSK